MPLGSPLPSPMALNRRSSSSSLFKKSSSPTPSSAASYLSALSEADARARGVVTRSPTSTPALSMSSSITSEDTYLYETDVSDFLSYPQRPPTSEQTFTTVHSEFGHCANEAYRYTSQHDPNTSLEHGETDPPYYILFSTYISYLILITLGHVRDFLGKRFHPSAYQHLMPQNVSCAVCFFNQWPAH
jgi:serine palmitoyltransferase